MEEKRCVIFCGGEISDDAFVQSQIKNDDIIICADKGLLHAQRLGIKPDFVLGDFDSYHGDLSGLQVKRFNSDKDYTDTHLAIEEGIQMGCHSFALLGALGGARYDHMIANIQDAFGFADKGYDISLLDQTNRIYCVVNREVIIERIPSYHLSVLSFSDRSTGVTLRGVKYPLTDVELSSTFPLGVSNEIVEDFALIRVKNGKLLIILSKD